MPGSTNQHPRHAIRLRGPWTVVDAPTQQAVGTVQMPARWSDLPSGLTRFQLTRVFHRPTGLTDRDVVTLDLREADAVRRIEVNGEPLASRDMTRLLRSSNHVVLSIEMPRATDPLEAILGEVQISIRSGDPPTLPSAQELNPIAEDLDGQVAAEHFLGKSLDEAVLLFEDNSLYYQEDLLWMGPAAFCFYVHAVIRYLKSDASVGDCDLVNCLHGILTKRLADDLAEITPVLEDLRGIAEYILAYWPKYEVDPEVYGDLCRKYQQLVDAF